MASAASSAVRSESKPNRGTRMCLKDMIRPSLPITVETKHSAFPFPMLEVGFTYRQAQCGPRSQTWPSSPLPIGQPEGARRHPFHGFELPVEIGEVAIAGLLRDVGNRA